MIKLFISLIFLLGIFLLVSYGVINKALIADNVDVASSVSKANQGLFAMGIIFIVAAVAFAMCKSNCAKMGEASDMSATMFLGFFAVLGIVLMSLSAALINGGVGSAKGWAVTNLVIGLCLILGCSGGLYLEHQEKIKQILKPSAKMDFQFF